MIEIFVHIVDDDEALAQMLGLLFTKNKILFKIFNDPETFIKTEEKKRICVIDCRFNNSGMTGFEVAEQVLEKYPRCYIIFITGYPDAFDMLELMNLKAFKNLSKNKSSFLDDLLKGVKQAIKLVEEEIILEEFAAKKNI